MTGEVRGAGKVDGIGRITKYELTDFVMLVGGGRGGVEGGGGGG